MFNKVKEDGHMESRCVLSFQLYSQKIAQTKPVLAHRKFATLNVRCNQTLSCY